MGDHTSITCYVTLDHAVTPEELAKWNDSSDYMSEEAYVPEHAPDTIMYQGENACGDAEFVADEALTTYPEATEITCWEDPKYEYLGTLWRYQVADVNSWKIRDEEEPANFWHNQDGWVTEEECLYFSSTEKGTLNLPVGGEWVPAKPKWRSYTCDADGNPLLTAPDIITIIRILREQEIDRVDAVYLSILEAVGEDLESLTK